MPSAEFDIAPGLPLDDAALDIAVFGFDGADDIPFIGFDDEAAAPSSITGPTTPLRQAPSPVQWLRKSVAAALGAISRALTAAWDELRFRLLGSSSRARRTRAAMVMLGAAIFSIGCGLLLRSWLPARQPAPVAAEPVAAATPRSVLVARTALPRGHLLHTGDLRWQPWPSETMKPAYIEEGTRNLEALGGYVVVEPIAAGEPVGATGVVSPGDRGFLAAALPPGMRAISVDIREETAASGLIMPGDEVDALLTLPVPADDRFGDERHAVQTVLTGIPVLAIDQRLDVPAEQSIIGHTATLAVTPKQAEIITLAGSMALDAGNLRLALRSLVGDRPVATTAKAATAGNRSYLLESDISKFFPARRPDSAGRSVARLTIVRRGAASVTPPFSSGS